MITFGKLESLYEQHLKKEESIYDDLKEKLYKKYKAEGYQDIWAWKKAENEILELRSHPKNVYQMPSRVPPGYDMGDLD